MKLRQYLCVILLGLILGVHNGHIALWKTGSATPVKVFPYRASMLPEQDRLLLEKGIPIESESQLHKILEDYLS